MSQPTMIFANGGWKGTLTGAAVVAALTLGYGVIKDFRSSAGEDATLRDRVDRIDTEQEKRTNMVREQLPEIGLKLNALVREFDEREPYVKSIPILQEQVSTLVKSQGELTRRVEQLTGSVEHNNRLMIEMLQSIGFTPTPKEPKRP